MKYLAFFLGLIVLAFVAGCTNQAAFNAPTTWDTLSSGWEKSIDYRAGDDEAKEVQAFEEKYNKQKECDQHGNNDDHHGTNCDSHHGNNDNHHGNCDGHHGNNDTKVVICHIPPGNPDNAHTITVDESAVPAHLEHGDTLGECPVTDDGYDPNWDDGDDDEIPVEDDPDEGEDDGGSDLDDLIPGDLPQDCDNFGDLPVTVTINFLNPNAPTYQGFPNFYMGTDMQYEVVLTNNSDEALHHLKVNAQFEYKYTGNYGGQAYTQGQSLAGVSGKLWEEFVIPANGTIVLQDNYVLDYNNAPTFFNAHVIIRRFSGRCLDGAVAVDIAATMYDPIPE
jgi:hypothetical protein